MSSTRCPASTSLPSLPNKMPSDWCITPSPANCACSHSAGVGSVLTIVLSEPNLSTIDALRFATGLCVETVLAPADEIDAAITRFYNVEPVIGQQASLVADVKLEVETRSYGEEAAAAFDQRSGALVQAALHGPHVTRHVHQRRNVAHSWYVGSLENQPSYEQAIADALRAMSGGGK